MMSHTILKIEYDHERLAKFCENMGLEELSVFGSVLRDDFGPNSDIDVLVEFPQTFKYSLFELVDIKDELEAIFGRRVDVVTRRAVQRGKNESRKQEILRTAKVIYDKTA